MDANGVQKGREPDFGRDIVIRAEQSTRYTPSYAVARMLKLNPLVLSRITSSFTVVVDDNRLNLGLNLKFEAKKLKVLGYSRRGDNGWEFSQKAIDLIKEYITKFPQFFQGIQRNPQGDLYSDTDFFDESESKAKVKEIQDWLKSVQSRSFEKVPLEAQQLDGDAVKEIEEAADEYMRGLEASKPRRIKSVPRKALLKPSDAEHRLQNQWFSLGDRVVYVQDSGKVPIATRGTVVGLTRTTRQTLLDVVFDLTFMSGTTLSDRCSPFRGMAVPVSSVLNLTNRQLIVESKASELAKPPPTNATPGRHTSTQPQLMGNFSTGNGRGGRDGARSPRGAWRGRGRGGIGSNGYNHSPPPGPRNNSHPNGYPSSWRDGGGSGGTTDLPVHGGPPVILQRSQASGDGYRNVPPPANINAPRRGKGGRGGGGRGRNGGGGGGGGNGARGARGNTHNNAQN